MNSMNKLQKSHLRMLGYTFKPHKDYTIADNGNDLEKLLIPKHSIYFTPYYNVQNTSKKKLKPLLDTLNNELQIMETSKNNN